MSGSPYEEIEPIAALRPWVRRLWQYGPCAPESEAQAIPPDGCPELIVHLGTPYAEQAADGGWRAQPRVLFAGQLTRPLVLKGTGPVEVMAVRFEPDGAAGVLGDTADTATDRRMDLTARHGDLPGLLRAQGGWRERFAMMQDWLAGQVGAEPDPVVRGMVRALEEGEVADSAFTTSWSPCPPVMGRNFGMSERQGQRRFKAAVGVSARQYGQILRFRRVFDRIERPEKPGWVEAALAAGYFDQPQMARDFRRYLGCTATQWARRSLGLAGHVSGAAPESYKA